MVFFILGVTSGRVPLNVFINLHTQICRSRQLSKVNVTVREAQRGREQKRKATLSARGVGLVVKHMVSRMHIHLTLFYWPRHQSTVTELSFRRESVSIVPTLKRVLVITFSTPSGRKL